MSPICNPPPTVVHDSTQIFKYSNIEKLFKYLEIHKNNADYFLRGPKCICTLSKFVRKQLLGVSLVQTVVKYGKTNNKQLLNKRNLTTRQTFERDCWKTGQNKCPEMWFSVCKASKNIGKFSVSTFSFSRLALQICKDQL